MTPKRFYFVMIGVFGLGLLAIGATIYFGNSFLQKSSAALVDTKLENKVGEEKERIYIQAKKDLVTYKELGTTIAKVLPKTKDQALAVQELYRIGDETGIVITGIRFPTSTLGVKAATATNTGAAATTPLPAQSSVTQSKAVEGIQGVLGIGVDLELAPARGKTISYEQMLDFLDKIQQNRRSMQITKVTVTPDIKNGGVDASLSVRIFVKP